MILLDNHRYNLNPLFIFSLLISRSTPQNHWFFISYREQIPNSKVHRMKNQKGVCPICNPFRRGTVSPAKLSRFRAIKPCSRLFCGELRGNCGISKTALALNATKLFVKAGSAALETSFSTILTVFRGGPAVALSRHGSHSSVSSPCSRRISR